MRAVITRSLVVVFGLVMVISCGPSGEEMAAEKEEMERSTAVEQPRKERPAAVEQSRKERSAALEKIRQERAAREHAKGQAAKENAAAENSESDKNAAASARAWLDREMNDPSMTPREYYKALENIEFNDGVLTAAISIADRDEAQKLCNMLNLGWLEREKYGMRRVRVILSGDGSELSRTVKVDADFSTCR